MTGIRAAHYDEAVKVLIADPIIIDMAHGLAGVPLEDLAHTEDGVSARFEFMMAANREYDNRGGEHKAHIGAVAEALLRLRGVIV